MSLSEEYQRQFAWREWSQAFALCPIAPGQRVLDLGCGPGDIAAELAARGAAVTGIDRDPELLRAARKRAPEARFEQQDLAELSLADKFDGIWCSFTAAYVVDFPAVFARWCEFLKSHAWICLIDIDDLLGQEPRSAATAHAIERFYRDAGEKRRYDFRMGRRLVGILQDQGFCVSGCELSDRELCFDGPAPPPVIEDWRARLARMSGLKTFFGSDLSGFAGAFIRALESPRHRSRCKVMCCVGTRG